MGKPGGRLDLALARELRKYRTRYCGGQGASAEDIAEADRKARVAEIVHAGARARYEGMPCRVKRRGDEKEWRRGTCKRYGVGTFQFVAQGREVVESLSVEDYEILNDFEWALQCVGAQVENTQRELSRLMSSRNEMIDAYRRLLCSRTVGGDRDRKTDSARGVMQEAKTDE